MAARPPLKPVKRALRRPPPGSSSKISESGEPSRGVEDRPTAPCPAPPPVAGTVTGVLIRPFTALGEAAGRPRHGKMDRCVGAWPSLAAPLPPAPDQVTAPIPVTPPPLPPARRVLLVHLQECGRRAASADVPVHRTGVGGVRAALGAPACASSPATPPAPGSGWASWLFSACPACPACVRGRHGGGQHYLAGTIPDNFCDGDSRGNYVKAACCWRRSALPLPPPPPPSPPDRLPPITLPVLAASRCTGCARAARFPPTPFLTLLRFFFRDAFALLVCRFLAPLFSGVCARVCV